MITVEGDSGVIKTAPWQPPPYDEPEVKIMRVEKVDSYK